MVPLPPPVVRITTFSLVDGTFHWQLQLRQVSTFEPSGHGRDLDLLGDHFVQAATTLGTSPNPSLSRSGIEVVNSLERGGPDTCARSTGRIRLAVTRFAQKARAIEVVTPVEVG